MSKLLVGMMTIGVAFGFLTAESVLYAGQVEPVEATEWQTQDEETAAHDAWRADLASAVAADEEYAAAEAAIEAYDGEDKEEHARLETVRDEIYYEMARPVYEDHFGPWEGDDEEFVVFLQSDDEAENQRKMVAVCTNNAIKACGEGKVKSVTVTGDGGCSYTCADATPIP